MDVLYIKDFQCIVKKAFISCTVRTIELFALFKEKLQKKKLSYNEVNLEKGDVWYYQKYSDIVMLEINSPVCKRPF